MKFASALFILLFVSIHAYATDLWVTTASGDGPGSLPAVLAEAKDNDVLKFNIPQLDKPLLAYNLRIDKSISIDGINHADKEVLTIEPGTKEDWILCVDDADKDNRRTVRLSNLKVEGGKYGGLYIGSYIDAELTHCTIAKNSMYAGTVGGMYIADNSSVLMEECTVKENRSSDTGGIFSNYSKLVVRNSVIEKNTCMFDGAGIHVKGGELHIEESQVLSNIGRGVYLIYADLHMKNCLIAGNSHTGGGNGAAINALGDTNVYIDNSQIIDNLGGEGGGIYSANNLVVKNTTIKGNVGIGSGGGISCYKDAHIENCIISENKGYNAGGGIQTHSLLSGTVVIDNCTISHNEVTNWASATSGGGICAFGPMVFKNSTVYNNKAMRAAGVYNSVVEGRSVFQNNTIAQNHADEDGGGIEFYLLHGAIGINGSTPAYPVLEIVNNTITGNTSKKGIAGIFLEADGEIGEGTMLMYNNIVANNTGLSTYEILNKPNRGKCIFRGECNIAKSGINEPDLKVIPYNQDSDLYYNPNPADYGGPTSTIMLSPTSMARGKGIASAEGVVIPTVDQRGVARASLPCIGAFEFTEADLIFTSIADAPAQQRLVYPSMLKANESMHINLPANSMVDGLSEVTVEVYSLSGKLLLTKQLHGSSATLTAPALPGVYLIRLSAGGSVYNEKIVVN